MHARQEKSIMQQRKHRNKYCAGISIYLTQQMTDQTNNSQKATQTVQT